MDFDPTVPFFAFQQKFGSQGKALGSHLNIYN